MDADFVYRTHHFTYGSLWQIQLAPISTQGAFTTGNKASGTVELTIGADVKNA